MVYVVDTYKAFHIVVVYLCSCHVIGFGFQFFIDIGDRDISAVAATTIAATIAATIAPTVAPTVAATLAAALAAAVDTAIILARAITITSPTWRSHDVGWNDSGFCRRCGNDAHRR